MVTSYRTQTSTPIFCAFASLSALPAWVFMFGRSQKSCSFVNNWALSFSQFHCHFDGGICPICPHSQRHPISVISCLNPMVKLNHGWIKVKSPSAIAISVSISVSIPQQFPYVKARWVSRGRSLVRLRRGGSALFCLHSWGVPVSDDVGWVPWVKTEMKKTCCEKVDKYTNHTVLDHTWSLSLSLPLSLCIYI